MAKKSVSSIAVAVAGLLVLATGAFAEQMTLDSGKDALVSGVFPTIPAGLDVYIAVVADWEIEIIPPTKSLVWFDVAELPSNVNAIQNATLKLYTTKIDDETQVDVFRASSDWNELTVTWDTRPGEDKALIASGTPTGEDVVFEVNVTEIVESWVLGGSPNYGFYMDAPDKGVDADMEFASKEEPTQAERPTLEITYTTGGGVSDDGVPEPPSLSVSPLSSGKAQILFNVHQAAPATLRVYDVSGALTQTLLDRTLDPGNHQLTWSPGQSGVYFVQLVVGGKILVEKAAIIK